MDGLYSPLLLGTVTDTEDLAASAMDFAPGVWLNPLLDSGDSFRVMAPEDAYVSADFDFDCTQFLHISKT